MSEVEVGNLFEEISADEWRTEGGGGSAERGLYTKVLVAFHTGGKRYARIPMNRGVFNGKKSSSVATALKNAKDAKSAPEGLDSIKVSSRGQNDDKGIVGMVFLENTAVADES
jgi:hypothetical protein